MAKQDGTDRVTPRGLIIALLAIAAWAFVFIVVWAITLIL